MWGRLQKAKTQLNLGQDPKKYVKFITETLLSCELVFSFGCVCSKHLYACLYSCCVSICFQFADYDIISVVINKALVIVSASVLIL